MTEIRKGVFFDGISVLAETWYEAVQKVAAVLYIPGDFMNWYPYDDHGYMLEIRRGKEVIYWYPQGRNKKRMAV